GRPARCQAGAEQLPDEHRHGAGRDGPEGQCIAVVNFEPDANGGELQTEDGHRDGDDQQGDEEGGAEVTSRAFSTPGRPRKPVGRNSRARISRVKAATSVYWSPKMSAPKASATPSTRPPSMAPGMLTMPPSTAAVNGLMPARKPMW